MLTIFIGNYLRWTLQALINYANEHSHISGWPWVSCTRSIKRRTTSCTSPTAAKTSSEVASLERRPSTWPFFWPFFFDLLWESAYFGWWKNFCWSALLAMTMVMMVTVVIINIIIIISFIIVIKTATVAISCHVFFDFNFLTKLFIFSDCDELSVIWLVEGPYWFFIRFLLIKNKVLAS